VLNDPFDSITSIPEDLLGIKYASKNGGWFAVDGDKGAQITNYQAF